jgi:class 3 adenylate cyclase/tetratricopeptide (TPR) repeat protein
VEERRIVTVLFCDVSGSTALADRLSDPEDWAEIISGAFPRLIDPVERYGGTVARLMGDAILAFFGAPTSREDDPQRAILAALAIQDGIGRYREEVREIYGVEISVRIGINTGWAVTGEFGSHAASEYTAMGDAVNVAARMEQTAEPGTIQVTADTYDQARDHFEFELLGAVEVKGKSDGVEAYRVVRRVARPGRRHRRAPTVGRERELDLLRYKLDEVDIGRGGIVALVGEPGLGKSRLLEELHREWFDVRGHAQESWIEDQLVSFDVDSPYGLLYRRLVDDLDRGDGPVPRNLDGRLAHILDRLDAGERERALQAVFDLVAGDRADDSGEMEGEEGFRHELTLVAEQLWRARVEQAGSCVYVIDDFHWADPASVDLFEQVVTSLIDLPLLIVLAFRPDRDAPCWAVHELLASELGVRYLTIPLAPLETRASASLVYALLPGARFPNEFRSTLLARIEGNPLFAEEIVRSLQERNVIERVSIEDDDCWQVVEGADLSSLEIPATLGAIVQERMDRLDGQAKHVLQLAAVIGRTFHRNELLAVVDDVTMLDDQLGVLQRLMLVRTDRQGGEGSYLFHHALIWEVVYRSILRRDRRQLHRQVGDALERMHAQDLDAIAGRLAFHFHAGQRWDKAFEYARGAGERAQALYAHRSTIEYLTRALDAADRMGQSPPARLLRLRGRARENLGDFPAAREDFTSALELARTSDDREQEWEALIDLGRSWEGLDYARAGEWFEQAIGLARQIGEPASLAHSLNRVGTWYTNIERVDEARAAHEEALAIFERLGDEAGIAATIDYLGTVADISGDMVEMRARYEEALAIFERLGDRHRMSSILSTMSILSGAFLFQAISMAGVASHAEALAWGARGLRLAREVGWRSGEAYALLNLGGVHVTEGDYRKAFENLPGALEIAREIDHLEWTTASTAILGTLHYDILAIDRAVEYLEESVALARASGSAHFLHLNAGFLIDTLIDQHNLDRVEEVVATFDLNMPMRTVGQRRLWAARANRLFATEDAEGAVSILDRLFESGYHARSQQDIPLLAVRRGAALRLLEAFDEAEEALLAGEAGALAIESPATLWRARLELARLYRIMERANDAEHALDGARAVIERLATGIPDETLRNGFLAGAAALFAEVVGERIEQPAVGEPDPEDHRFQPARQGS